MVSGSAWDDMVWLLRRMSGVVEGHPYVGPVTCISTPMLRIWFRSFTSAGRQPQVSRRTPSPASQAGATSAADHALRLGSRPDSGVNCHVRHLVVRRVDD